MRPRFVSDEAILDAARACLLARGPSATVGEIAERLGVSGPALLKRFGTKEKLVTQALLAEAPPDLSHGPEPGPLQPQLVALLLQLERLLLLAVPKLATLRAGGVEASRWLSQDHPRMARRNLLAWLESAHRSHHLAHADLEAAADLLVSLVEARGFLGWLEPTWLDNGDQWATRAVDALFGELGPKLTCGDVVAGLQPRPGRPERPQLERAARFTPLRPKRRASKKAKDRG